MRIPVACTQMCIHATVLTPALASLAGSNVGLRRMRGSRARVLAPVEGRRIDTNSAPALQLDCVPSGPRSQPGGLCTSPAEEWAASDDELVRTLPSGDTRWLSELEAAFMQQCICRFVLVCIYCKPHCIFGPKTRLEQRQGKCSTSEAPSPTHTHAIWRRRWSVQSSFLVSSVAPAMHSLRFLLCLLRSAVCPSVSSACWHAGVTSDRPRATLESGRASNGVRWGQTESDVLHVDTVMDDR